MWGGAGWRCRQRRERPAGIGAVGLMRFQASAPLLAPVKIVPPMKLTLVVSGWPPRKNLGTADTADGAGQGGQGRLR